MVKKLVVYGLGLAAPSLALSGIRRELDLEGTGNGGATVVESAPGTLGSLGLRARAVCAVVPLDTRAVRRISFDFAGPK